MDIEDLDVEQEDNFDKIYKGEISKSGAAILPSKRVRKIPIKITNTSKAENEKDEIIAQTDQQVDNDSLSTEKK